MKSMASLLLVDDDSAFRNLMAAELSRLGHKVATASNGIDALAKCEQTDPEVVLLDLRLPGIDGLEVLKSLRERHPSSEVIMLTGHGTIDTAIDSIRRGAFDYVIKPCPLDELDLRIQRATERRSLRLRASLLERGLTPPDLADSFIGESTEFRELLRLIDRVGPSDSTVLIFGETGSGKERVAKLIHGRSTRKDRPFVVVDCAALQESLLQSELFGHERGAFTGADRAKPGLFEVAHRGTIFLDEIGEISPATQTKLLRVLDTSTFRRVGGTSEIHVDVRVLAATNRNLPAMIHQGQFREDLYYRMSTISMELPPLRKRGSDVERIANYFVGVMNERFQSSKRIGEEALRLLRRHTWPGNVRELLRAVEGAMVVCEGTEILPSHLPPALRNPAGGEHAEKSSSNGTGEFLSLEALEKNHIERALQLSGGHRGNAARMLGLSERSLYRKMNDFGWLREE